MQALTEKIKQLEQEKKDMEAFYGKVLILMIFILFLLY